MSEKLKNCPFCGEKNPFLVYRYETMYEVRCMRCEGSSGLKHSTKEVIEVWNTRPVKNIELAVNKLVDALRQQIIFTERIGGKIAKRINDEAKQILADYKKG